MRAGEAVVVGGANGSGKSTLLRTLAGLIVPSAGSVVVAGTDLRRRAAPAGSVALIGHDTALQPDLTVRENLELVARLLGCPHAEVDAVLAEVGLAAAADRTAASCSAGMIRRAEFARALLARPALLLLDEPDVALDRDARRLVGAIAHGVRRAGGAVVVVSHDAEQAGRALSAPIAWLRGGRLEIAA